MALESDVDLPVLWQASILLMFILIPTYSKILITFASKKSSLHKKWRFPLRISTINMTKSATADLVTFTEEILIEKLYFLCSAWGIESWMPEISGISLLLYCSSALYSVSSEFDNAFLCFFFPQGLSFLI